MILFGIHFSDQNGVCCSAFTVHKFQHRSNPLFFEKRGKRIAAAEILLEGEKLQLGTPRGAALQTPPRLHREDPASKGTTPSH